MSGGPGVASSEDPYRDGGSGEWRRIYDRVEALLPQLAAERARVEEINRTQCESSEAREKSLHARLVQAEASRRRWKTAYIELPLLANPKIIELKENDSKDYRTCEDANNSRLEVRPKEPKTGVEPGKNNENHEGITGDIRAELRKLKQAYETLSSNKDKEIYALLGVKDFLWNQLRTIDKENMALLTIKEVEAAQATEAAQKLQQNIEEMEVAALKVQQNIEDMKVASQTKDDKVSRLQAESGNVKKRVLILDGKLLEMYSLVKEKNDEIQKLKYVLEAGQKRRKTAYDLEQCTIFVMILNGKTITLEVKRSETIYDVKAKIHDKVGILPTLQRLMFGDRLLVDIYTLENYFIGMESTLTLHLVLQGMHIFVRTVTGKTTTLEVDRADTVYSVKAKIFNETGTVPAEQRLVFFGKKLEENRTLTDYGIENDSVIHVLYSRQCGTIHISVRTPTGRTVIEHFAMRSETISDLKVKIRIALGIPLDQQRLFLCGKLLQDGCTLAFYGIRESLWPCILLLQLRLPGGQ